MAYKQSWGGGYEVPQSKYNSALFKIQRLNDSWISCRTHWRSGDWVSLNEELKLIWLELCADATDKQKEINKKFKTGYIEVLQSNKVSFAQKKKHIFALLEKKWGFLFKVEKDQGLGKAYINPEEDNWF